MKILSFKKPVIFNKEGLIIEDLAYNHKYSKVKRYNRDYLMVSGADEECNRTYNCYYDTKGQFKFIEYTHKQRSKALLPWHQINESISQTKQFSDCLLSVNKTYHIVNGKKSLFEIIFHFQRGNEEFTQIFNHHNDGWKHEGNRLEVGTIMQILAERR